MDDDKRISFWETFNPDNWTLGGWVWVVLGGVFYCIGTWLMISEVINSRGAPPSATDRIIGSLYSGAVTAVIGIVFILFAPIIRYFNDSGSKRFWSCLGLFFLVLFSLVAFGETTNLIQNEQKLKYEKQREITKNDETRSAKKTKEESTKKGRVNVGDIVALRHKSQMTFLARNDRAWDKLNEAIQARDTTGANLLLLEDSVVDIG